MLVVSSLIWMHPPLLVVFQYNFLKIRYRYRCQRWPGAAVTYRPLYATVSTVLKVENISCYSFVVGLPASWSQEVNRNHTTKAICTVASDRAGQTTGRDLLMSGAEFLHV